MIINKKSGTSIMLVLLLLMPVFLPLRADAFELKSLTDNGMLRDATTNNSLISGSGARATFHKISNDEINFDISLIEKLGSVYLVRKRQNNLNEVKVVFTSSSGNSLSLRTAMEGKDRILSTVSFNETSVKVIPPSDHKPNHNFVMTAEIESLFAKAKVDTNLNKLITEALPFLNANSIMKVLPATSDHYYVSDCAVEATDCLVALVAYGLSMGALVSACGFSFGASCVAALIAHPVLGGAVAIYCGRAVESCGLNK